jgi:pyruvate/2-oxoglutarate dehydrogenase complex dihydrolipoamide acyltransferase (E2) component
MLIDVVAEGTVDKWLVHEKDIVSEGQALLVTMVDKASTTIYAPVAGKIGQLLVKSGDVITKGTVITRIDDQVTALPGSNHEKNMEVCGSCGVLRIDRQAKCAHCRNAHTPRAMTAPRSEDSFWACIECSFTCRMCAFVVPLNHLDMDGAVLCARCGLEQAFDVRGWVDALQYSHAATELFGTRARGIEDDLMTLGVKRVSAQHAVPGANAFTITISPGIPLCSTCHAPFELALDKDGASTISCKTCNTTARYQLPVAAQRMMKASLQAVIADQHRSDRATVKVDDGTGAIAVRCPSCSAALPATSDSKFITCKYCNTTSRIPDHQWFRISGKEPTPESMWLLFHGESRAHKDFNRKKQQQEDAVRRRLEKEREQQQQVESSRAALQARAQAAGERTAADDAHRHNAEQLQRAAPPSVATESAPLVDPKSAERRSRSASRTPYFVVLGFVVLGAAATALALFK